MIIAFSGMDGSGKTALSQKLKEELVARGYSVVVIEPFRYVVWTPLLKLFRRGGDFVSTGGCEKRNRFFLFKLWPLLALLDHWVYFLLKIKPLKRKYDYVIADRFFFDFAGSFKYFGYTTEWLDKLYLKLVPKPDLTFVLDLPPGTALDREVKGAHTISFFISQRRYYLGLSSKFDLRCLDASSSTQELVEKVLELV